MGLKLALAKSTASSTARPTTAARGTTRLVGTLAAERSAQSRLPERRPCFIVSVLPGGANPAAGLVAVNGVRYGTTEFGGAQGAGVLFAITLSGTQTVLRSFGATGDGLFPIGGLVNLNGALFGTTWGGGAHARGTVFSLTANAVKP
jgi:uncharacterized repeat protein (TIGR03803 family)